MENSRNIRGKVDNGYGLPDSPLFPGYSQEYYEEIVRQTGNRFLETPPKY